MTLNLPAIRAHFPALTSEAIYFDNPGGTQVPNQTIDRMVDYLVTTNANLGGAFSTSRATDALIEVTRQGIADFLNAAHPEEIVFGPNMTSLTFALSRTLAREFEPDDEIIVTHLDHDANITPWTILAEERGCHVRWLDFDVEDCTLRLDQLETLLSDRTKLVAVGYASNAVGTINPVAKIDVRELDCDFLVVSAYKFFGPHIGMLYGKLEHLERLQAYRVRPAPVKPPGKFESGTKNHEGIAGSLGTLEYLTDLGQRYGSEHIERYEGDVHSRRLPLAQAMSAIRAYEMELSRALIETLSTISAITIWGITDRRELDRRVPTISFTMNGRHPREIADKLGEAGIYAWDGNYYALAVTQRLGLEDRGGMVRVGLVHYNTLEEIARLGEVLEEIAKKGSGVRD
jgi:selenocysteine lyase/cysteine desulfurase